MKEILGETWAVFSFFFSLRRGSSGKGFRLLFFGCFFWNVVEAFEMRELYEREHRRQRYIYNDGSQFRLHHAKKNTASLRTQIRENNVRATI